MADRRGIRPHAERFVRISHDSGSYREHSLAVEVEAPIGCTVALTTDGSAPTAAHDTGQRQVRTTLEALGRSVTGHLFKHRDLMLMREDPDQLLFDSPNLPSGRVLRAAAVRDGAVVGEPTTRVFLLGTDLAQRFPGCLVVSIVADPADLLDYERGILAKGAIYDEWLARPEAEGMIRRQEHWLFEANLTQTGRAWERPCLLQVYDGGTTPAVEAPAGLRVGGKSSRMESQRPFTVTLREEYGSDRLGMQLFEGSPDVDVFRLRAGGNNTKSLKFKDVLLQELVGDRRLVAARSRMAVLFLNGEYWGPYFISEWVGARMLHDRLGVDEGQVVMMVDGELAEGAPEDLTLYEQLMAHAERDLSQPDAWEEFCRVMDVRSFADIIATRVYVGCADWSPTENDVLWRTRDASYNGGRWQCVPFDLEFSSGLYGGKPAGVGTDHFGWALRRYPLFAAAMRNREFRRLFLEALRSIGSACYAPERVEEGIRRHTKVWEPLMRDCYRRYGNTRGMWNAELAATLSFFRRRYGIIVPIAEAWCEAEDAR